MHRFNFIFYLPFPKEKCTNHAKNCVGFFFIVSWPLVFLLYTKCPFNLNPVSPFISKLSDLSLRGLSSDPKLWKTFLWKPFERLSVSLFPSYGNLLLFFLVAKLCLTLLQPPGLQIVMSFCPWDFSGKNTGMGSHSPSPGDLSNTGIEPRSPALTGGFFTTEPPGKL